MARIRLTLLGGFEATVLGRAVQIPAGKARALLGYVQHSLDWTKSNRPARSRLELSFV
jgi:hypothetical protein